MSPDRLAWVLRAAEAFDAWRSVPRALVAGYGALVWRVSEWFMQLPDPTATQSAFVSVVWGAAAGVFGLYVSTGRKWGKDDG